MFAVYVLRSRTTGRYYTGSTADLATRLLQHNGNLSISTKNRGPWDLVYKEEYATRVDAMARERYFKTGAGRDEMKRILGSKCPIETGIAEPG